MSHISSEGLSSFKHLLEVERSELEAELAAHGKKNPETKDWTGAAADFEADEEEADPIDVGDKMEELAKNVSIVEQLERRYKDVVDALERITTGAYGIDENTGEEIPLERLKANPAARTKVQ